MYKPRHVLSRGLLVIGSSSDSSSKSDLTGNENNKKKADIYSEEDVRLRAVKSAPEYRVQLPKGMDPSLSDAEKEIVEKKEAAQRENPEMTELDLLKAQLRQMLERMESEMK
jgi:hypothetical protein